MLFITASFFILGTKVIFIPIEDAIQRGKIIAERQLIKLHGQSRLQFPFCQLAVANGMYAHMCPPPANGAVSIIKAKRNFRHCKTSNAHTYGTTSNAVSKLPRDLYVIPF